MKYVKTKAEYRICSVFFRKDGEKISGQILFASSIEYTSYINTFWACYN